MNWVLKIQQILGVFWTELFKSFDFIDAVKTALVIAFTKGHGAQLSWMASLFVSPEFAAKAYGVYPIYIPVDSVLVPPPTFADVISGSECFVDPESPAELYEGQVVCISGYAIPVPDWLSDHAVGNNKMLRLGFDYTYDPASRRFIFASIQDIRNLPRIMAMGADGSPRSFYVLFGHKAAGPQRNDAVAGFVARELAAQAADVWRVHVEGASVYAMKKLLASSTGCVVCEEDGVVQGIWQEQGMTWLRVGSRLYGSDRKCNVVLGNTVTRGTVLFGYMNVWGSEDSPTLAQVPGMLVQTDAGELIAQNSTEEWLVRPATGEFPARRVLPLVGPDAVRDRYIELCGEIQDSGLVPLPEGTDSPVNPYAYVVNMRKRRFQLIQLEADSLSDVDPALEEIRRSSPAEAMVTVFIKDTSESISDIDDMYDASKTPSMRVKFAADVCMAGVAEVLTLKISAMNAEARQLV